jgi:hypothetical protein
MPIENTLLCTSLSLFVFLPPDREIKSTVELIEERLTRYNLVSNPLCKDDQQPGLEGGLSKEAGLMLKVNY